MTGGRLLDSCPWQTVKPPPLPVDVFSRSPVALGRPRGAGLLMSSSEILIPNSYYFLLQHNRYNCRDKGDKGWTKETRTMTKETTLGDKRDTIPFITFYQDCGLTFHDRLCWSLLVYRRRVGAGCKEHEVVRRTHLGRKGVHAALARLAAKKLVFRREGLYYARRPTIGIAHEKRDSAGKKWYKRFAYWKCRLTGRPVEDVLLALLQSLARGGTEAGNQSDAGLGKLVGVHPKTVGRKLARLEAQGLLQLRKRRTRFDVILRPAATMPQPLTPRGQDTPFGRGYELLADCRVPVKFLKNDIIPLVEQLAGADHDFDLSAFVTLIEEADRQHGQTGKAAHPGFLLRHMLQQRLPTDGDMEEKAAQIRFEQHMVELENHCRQEAAYWSAIDYLPKIKTVSCCGTDLKLEFGRRVFDLDPEQVRVEGTIRDLLPDATVIVNEYRLVCRECRTHHRCSTADVYAAVGGWATHRHVVIHHDRQQPADARVTVSQDDSHPDSLLVSSSRVIPYASTPDKDTDFDFLALLDAIDAEPEHENENQRDVAAVLMPTRFADDLLYKKLHPEDLETLRPALVAASCGSDEDEEAHDTHEEIFEN
jgi:hypothetical protein